MPIHQISQESTCVGSIFNKVDTSPTQVFFCEIYKMFQNNFFYRTPPVAASDGSIHFFTLLCNVSKIAMKACFPSYRNKSRDIRLVSMSRENETFSNVARKKNSGLHWISRIKIPVPESLFYKVAGFPFVYPLKTSENQRLS